MALTLYRLPTISFRVFCARALAVMATRLVSPRFRPPISWRLTSRSIASVKRRQSAKSPHTPIILSAARPIACTFRCCCFMMVRDLENAPSDPMATKLSVRSPMRVSCSARHHPQSKATTTRTRDLRCITGDCPRLSRGRPCVGCVGGRACVVGAGRGVGRARGSLCGQSGSLGAGLAFCRFPISRKSGGVHAEYRSFDWCFVLVHAGA